MKECDEDNNGVIDELEFVRLRTKRLLLSGTATRPDCPHGLLQVNWFKGSEVAQALKRQVRKEKKLQAAYAELGVAVAASGESHGLQAMHAALEVDALTGHHGTDGATMQRAWAAHDTLPGNP